MNFNEKMSCVFNKIVISYFMTKKRISVRELKFEIERLRFIGGQMSNICFNLSQQSGRVLVYNDCKIMGDLVRQWDKILRSYKP